MAILLLVTLLLEMVCLASLRRAKPEASILEASTIMAMLVALMTELVSTVARQGG